MRRVCVDFLAPTGDFAAQFLEAFHQATWQEDHDQHEHQTQGQVPALAHEGRNNLGRDMLPKIRREHFHIEGEELPDGMDVVFYRDMMLDQHIGHLSFAVQTALDEYKAQLQEQYDDEVRAEELGVLPAGESTESLSGQIDDLNQTVSDATGKLDAHELGQTPEGETLSRRMTDSANLSHAARAQIRQRPIVRRWLDATAEALSKAGCASCL